MSEFLQRFGGPLAQELAGEVSTALGLSGRRLQHKLDLLRQFDADPSLQRHRNREHLVAEAGEALWGYVVQREIFGLRDAEEICVEYCVPNEVRKCMGPAALQRRGRSRGHE